MHESLTGQKIGRLLIGDEFKKNGRIYYHCKCECGKEKDIYRYGLISKTSTSCGCYSNELTSKITSKDYTNQQFGKLKSIKRLPNYKNNKTYYECICDCGNTRIVYGNDLKSGKVTMCKECSEINRLKKKRKDYTGQKFGRLIILNMIYERYGKTKALCKCDCGNEKIIDIQNILNGHTLSCGCYEQESRCNREHSVDISGRRFGMLNVIKSTEQHSSNGSMIWECLCDCGNITYTTYSSLNSGHTLSCGCRKNSKWEDFIDSYLKSLNIEFEREKRFNDCKNLQNSDMLPFDFYIESKNIIIEYDGLHHFKPIPYWGGDEKFEITKRNDSIKNNYCKSHNITLLRLPYTLKENEIIDKIQNILNP